MDEEDYYFDNKWYLCTRAATDTFYDGQLYQGVIDKKTGEHGLMTCNGPVWGMTLSEFVSVPPTHLDSFDDSQFEGKSTYTPFNKDTVETLAGGKPHTIKHLCESFGDFLQAKNDRYGNSVGEPIQVFNKADTTNAFYVRMDDKLSRIANRPPDSEPRENDLVDLAGYIILLLHQRGVSSLEHHID
jgi:hypothetical protein